MKRRETLKLFGVAAVAAAIGVAGIPGLSFAQDQKKMVTVVKIAGIPWFNALENGVKKAGTDFGIDTSVVGPANLDPAQQVKLLEDLIAQKVDVIGLVPIDVKVAEPVLKRAQEAGIPVITHEGPEQEGRTWWQAHGASVKGALAKANVAAQDVFALCVDTTCCSVATLERDGRPLRPAMIWMDVRSARQADAIAATRGADALIGMVGLGVTEPGEMRQPVCADFTLLGVWGW